ncbi:iron transporter [Pseudomonas daroniae]|uniref:Iron transporter n=1 Tax=Phytopseudomonas daroniae TaxID=2487519 RepID=A0A4Q9QIR8_9GAMM|nr:MULTISPECIES: iron transporter [Pseudomonas]TBU76539.1 iron transporter [Pseudomonas daroniae]TBU80916.1 iron transporter [Pseudomonas sp. FRB 228]TBU90154.1 iron transporter [Pseudomonas daroniae]
MAARKSSAPTGAWRAVVLRILAAVLGGYAVAYAFNAALARLLPLAKVDALIVASLLSFAIYTLAILWAFGAASAWRAWAGMGVALPLAAIGFWPWAGA